MTRTPDIQCYVTTNSDGSKERKSSKQALKVHLAWRGSKWFTIPRKASSTGARATRQPPRLQSSSFAIYLDGDVFIGNSLLQVNRYGLACQTLKIARWLLPFGIAYIISAGAMARRSFFYQPASRDRGCAVHFAYTCHASCLHHETHRRQSSHCPRSIVLERAPADHLSDLVQHRSSASIEACQLLSTALYSLLCLRRLKICLVLSPTKNSHHEGSLVHRNVPSPDQPTYLTHESTMACTPLGGNSPRPQLPYDTLFLSAP